MSVHRVAIVAFMAAMLSTAALAIELEEAKSDLDQRVEVEPAAFNSKEAAMDIFALVADFAARSTTYSSLLTLNVANVIILALIAFVALGYFGFLDFGTGRAMARSVSNSLLNSENMDSVMMVVEVALEKLQQLDGENKDLDGQL